MHWQVKIYPDNVHYQSKKGKSVTLAKNRTGARDAVDDARKSLGKEGERDARAGKQQSHVGRLFVGKRVVSEETG